MAEVIEAFPGLPAQLALTAADGRVDLYPRATIFNGSPVPVAATNLDHWLIGYYRGEIALNVPGVYRAVYRNFLDAGRTAIDRSREQDQDTIIIHPLDPPRLGVVYDSQTHILYVDASVSRDGKPMPAAELVAARWSIYDADDSLWATIDDAAPDAEGVFRAQLPNPPLVADRLYYLRLRVTMTWGGEVTANLGFQTNL